jgi:hypothetical protein
MDFRHFEGKRWTIVYGSYEGLEEYAVNELHKTVQQFLPYILTSGDGSSGELQNFAGFNIIFIGTVGSNRHLAKLAGDGIFRPEHKKEGYAMKVCRSPFDPEMQIIILAGADDNGTLYAVRDFEHFYVDPNWYFEGYHFKNGRYYDGSWHFGTRTFFTEKIPETEKNSAPAIENRGLWSWGHVIYDYRKYIDNMSRWKLNFMILWNDYAPVNARQIVEYAHSRGIKVIWAYSWCWGEDVDASNEEDLKKWTKRAIDIYEKQYRDVGGDGIYFQTFTEVKETSINNECIATLVSGWVRSITDKLLKKYPDLWIQFGIHATSIREDLDKLSVDPRISIVWEDAGSFPFAYDVKDVKNIDETLEYLSRISELRGKDEDFGMIVKGCITLDWPTFEHQKGPFILGEASESFKESRVGEQKIFWKYIQTYWIKNLKYMLGSMRIVAKKDIKRVSVSTLIEDGMWEERMWLPGILSAEGMWDPFEEPETIMEKVMLAKDTFFA